MIKQARPLTQAQPPHALALLRFGSDVGTRRRWFVPASFSHPAKLHLGLVAWLVERYTAPGDIILDPMGGIGSTLLATLLQRDVVLYDVEARYLETARANAVRLQQAAGLFAGQATLRQHDARQPWPDGADHILCSPPYGCAASPNAQTRSGWLSQRARAVPALSQSARWQQLLAHPSPGTLGAYQFHYGTHPAQIGHWRGQRYWQAMAQVYGQAHAALHPGGTLMLVIKDHIREGQRVPVSDHTVALCERLGFVLIERHVRQLPTLSLWMRRRREAGLPVVDTEDVVILQHGGSPCR